MKIRYKKVCAIFISWLQSSHFLNGNRYIGGTSKVISNKKLKNLFSLNNRNLMKDNIKESSPELKYLIP